MPDLAAGDGPGRTRCISRTNPRDTCAAQFSKTVATRPGDLPCRVGTPRRRRGDYSARLTVLSRASANESSLGGSRPVASAKRRFPTWSTLPASSAAGRSSVAGSTRLAVDADRSLVDQPARLAAADPEAVADQGRQVDGLGAVESVLGDVVGDPAVAGGPGRSGPPPPPRSRRRRSDRRSAARARAWPPSGGGRRRAARRAAAPSTDRARRRGRSSACRRSPPAGSVDADVVAERLAHLPDAVGAGQDRHGHHDLRALPERALDVAAEEQVELLVGAAELEVGLRPRPSRSPAAPGRAARASRSAAAAAIRLVKSSRSSSRATVKRRASPNSSALGMSSHSLLKRTSVSSRSRTLKACSWKVVALASISSSAEHGPHARSGRSDRRPGPV